MGKEARCFFSTVNSTQPAAGLQPICNFQRQNSDLPLNLRGMSHIKQCLLVLNCSEERKYMCVATLYNPWLSTFSELKQNLKDKCAVAHTFVLAGSASKFYSSFWSQTTSSAYPFCVISVQDTTWVRSLKDIRVPAEPFF